MAPNAEPNQIRQRLVNKDGTDVVDAVDAATTSTLTQLKDIKSTDVVIDSVIYDLKSFHHPGGETILLFGGNDVTVQYKMIHPYHTSKHLEKMTVVGKVKAVKDE